VYAEQGIEKGDRVCIYLPMIPELAITFWPVLELTIHSVVFAGFSASAVATRINDKKWSSLQMVDIAGTKRLI
jgi:acetyl-CoA synthetase